MVPKRGIPGVDWNAHMQLFFFDKVLHANLFHKKSTIEIAFDAINA
jgi:hypothetical protein